MAHEKGAKGAKYIVFHMGTCARVCAVIVNRGNDEVMTMVGVKVKRRWRREEKGGGHSSKKTRFKTFRQRKVGTNLDEMFGLSFQRLIILRV